MLNNAGCEISHESEKQVVAVKRMSYGRIYIRIKRQSVHYAQTPEKHYYWLADIHFQKGFGHRLFDSKEVREFVERYVKPFTRAEPKHESVSLTLDGIKALDLHAKEKLTRDLAS
jgi:hypothetical protein